MKKRYLITYSNKNIDYSKISSLLNTPKESIFEGMSFLEDENDLDNETLHFTALGISSAVLAESNARELSEKDEILAIEEDAKMYILGFPSDVVKDEENLWNIDMVKAPEAWKKGATGKGVNLAILDTGIASHPDLVITGGVSFVSGVTSYNDGNGHGTHCAGIAAGRNGLNKVYGVAKDCNLYAVKVLADNGEGIVTSIIAGMNWCIENKISVASMSLGGPFGPTVAYNTAVKECQEKGVTVVCASGNGFLTVFPWVQAPANSFIRRDGSSKPTAVGAIDKNKTIASFSSRGTKDNDWNPVSVVAPGVEIYSTYLNDGYKTMSGTSMACPHVAGLAALLHQKNPDATALEIKACILSTANILGDKPIPNTPYGYGLINCLTAINEI